MIFDRSSILPKTTLIEGAPGIGKTVMAKEIASRWAQNKMLPDIKLLLLIYLKKTDINQIKNFEELMQVCYENKDLASHCANYFVKTQGKNLMIIFDGYDEMATKKQKKDDTYFIKLLKRISLPECYLVITSRPYITAHLHRYCNCRVEIMGFTENDRLSYLKENLSVEKFQIVTEFLQKNPIIDSFCYIPLHLINFLSLVKYDIQLPKTQTELTGNTIRLTIARNKRKETGKLSVSVLQDKGIEKIIASIAGFAYKMLDKEQFVFSEEEMKSAGANMEDINDAYGLLKAVQLNDVENVLHQKVYNFVHFSVQEYLAAYHLSTMYNIEQSFVLNHKFWDGKYLGVWRMYAGLTKGDSFPFKAFLSHEWYITAGIRHLFGFKSAGIAEKLKKNKVFCLQLYQIFLEAPDSKIKESFSTVVKNDTIDLSEGNLSITETNILSHFIAKSSTTKKWQTINLSKCGIDDDKLQSFYQGLCIEDGREKPIINNLNISNNNIRKLNKIFGLIAKFKIVHLNASNNYLTYKCVTLNVEYFSKTLKFLDLSSNQFENEDVYNLCKGLVKCKNLEELYLNNNIIDESAESSLVEAIFQWDNLKEFKCENNAFSNPRYTNSLFEFTVKHLKYINNSKENKVLDFYEETENITYFVSVLKYTKHLSEKNSKYISCISQLRRLSLECADSEHIPLTTNASIFFLKHFKILEAINLSGLIINEESAHNLVAALSNKLQYLKMNDCKLTSKVAKLIAHKIKIIRSIKELQLCNNHIDDEATKELLIAFLHCNSFERFKFEGNKFEDKSKSLFKFLLSHLNFSGSSLSNLDDVTSFITLLEYMKEVPTVKSVLVGNVSKVHHLNLSMNFVDHQPTDTQLELTIVSSQGFEIFHNLMSLNISGIIISENTTSCLVKAFGNNLQLEQLFMNKCQITSPTIIVFCQQLKFNFLKVFELAENCIDDEATEELAIAILHWNLLEYIKLGKNQFTYQGMLLLEMLTKDLESEVIINFINNHYIVKSFVEVLDYTSNNTGERVNQFLSNLIKVTKISLQVETALELTFNASIILQKLRNMTSLNISGIIITEQVATNLCNFFDNNQKSLKQLIMNGCRLNSKKILNFVHELRFTNELMEAEFCENEIDDDATKPLVIAILHWNVLKTLRLENNCFTEISKGLFEILKEFSNSTSVSIDYNDKVNRIIPFITLLRYIMETDIKNSKFVQNVSKVEKLLLDCSNHNNSNVQFIVNASKFFTRFVNLTDLNISGMVICQEVADNLAKAFDSNLHSLECLIMNNCQLTSAIVFIVIIKLRNCLRMREFQLCNNFIDDDVTQVLVISIFRWNYFKVFEFEGNQFNKESKAIFQFLLSHLQFSALSLNLSSDLDRLTSFITLLGYIKDVPTNTSCYIDNISKLRHLDLNCLEQQTSLELTVNSSEGFQIFNHIISLNISGIIITEQIAKNLCSFFDNNQKSLKQLIMNGCKLNSKKILSFIHKLRFTNELMEAEFCENEIDDDATKPLVIAILHWNVLKTLRLENNCFTEISKGLFEILKEFSNSTSVSIDYNDEVGKIIPFITLLGYTMETDIENSKFVENVSKIEKLLLDCSNHNNSNVQFIVNASKFFTRFVNLTDLNISGMVICKEVANNLANALDVNLCSLEHVIMNNCQLTSSTDTLDLFKKLKKCLKLKELQLCNNCLDNEATEALVVSILHLNVLETLKVDQNCFSEKYEKALTFLINNLKFSDSVINFNDRDNIIAFITLLEYMQTISVNVSDFVDNVSKVKRLSLVYIPDEKLELSPKASQFFERFNLTKLNISGLIIIEGVVDNLLKAFSADLEYLFMNNCNLSSRIVIKLMQKLQNAKNIKKLDLCNNSIDDEATEPLSKAILHWNLLEYIQLGKNQFTSQSMLLLEMLTKDLESEVIIDFLNNHYVVKSFIKVLDYTSNNTGERVNQFLSNLVKVTKISLQVEAALELTINASITLQKLRNMTSLNISGIIITEQVAKNLCSFFDNNQKTFKQLIMNGCKLNSKKILSFVHELRFTKELMEAEFFENEIDDDATKPLVIAILHWNVLKTLRLENNCFTEISKGLFEILKEFSNSTSVSIDYNDEVGKIIPFITLLGYTMETDIKNSMFVENVSKIEKLLLDCSNHNNSNVQFIVNASKFFTRFVNLTDLNISGMVICQEVADNLAKAFDSNLHSLEHLIMNNCQLTSTDTLDLFKKLKNCLNLKELQLCNNYLDNEATEALVVSILRLNVLETLKVDQNCFSEKYEKALTFLTNNLKFSDSVINFNDRDNIIAFITLLEYMQTISVNVSDFVDSVSKVKRLSLVYIPDEKLELSPKASQFFERFNLTKLNISGLIIIEGVVDNLLKAFSADLEYLFMNNCNLSSRIVIKLMQKLQNAKNIKKLDLCNNSIDDEATEPLSKAILHWNLLEYIQLGKNQFTSQSMLLLEMLTKDLESEVIIDFLNNHYVVKSFIKVLDYTSNNTGERVNQFLSNLVKVTKISLQVEAALELTINASITLQKLRNMTSLNISGIIITEQVANNLCSFFDNNQKSLKQLIMNGCRLNSKKILNFVHELRFTNELMEAEFCENEIDDDATKPLVIAILHWNVLKTLRLENNCFTEISKGLFEILKEFSNSTSVSIDYNDKVNRIIPFITLLGYTMETDIKNSKFVQNVSKVEKLLLDCSNHNNSNVQFIVNASKFFTRFVNLTDLNISGMVICKEVANNLAKAFDSNLHSLECLIMNSCQLTSAIAFILIIKLRKCLRMRELQLCNNFIDDDVTQVLVISIFQWNYFKVFEFEGNQFNKESKSLFQFLLSHLKFSDFSLNLSGNFDHLTSFITLLQYMKDVPTNTSRYVDNISKIGCLGLNCLKRQTSLELTFQVFNDLILLNISGIIISENTANCLVKAFSNNLQLERLFMNKCQITSPTINVFCQQLKFNSLKVFELNENCIDDEATEPLAIAILHWNLLEHIELENNWLSIQSMLLLEMLTKDLGSEVTINFINNYYVVKSFIKLLDYANNNSSKGVKQFLNNLMKVTKISLQVETPLEMTLNASITLRQLQSITLFDINGILINEQVANNICALFDNNQKSLRNLLINNCSLSSNTIMEFGHKLKTTTNMIEAQFCGNKIDDFSTKYLVIAILYWNNLETLKLENNCFKENSIEMFEILKDFLKCLNTCPLIDYNGKVNKIIPFITLLGYMMDVDVKDSILVENVSKVKNLQLDCSNQYNNNVQFEVNASMFFRRFVNLTHLDISGIAIKKEVADNLAKAFDFNLYSLEHLIMNKCQLTSADTLDLFKKLKNCLKLKELQLCSNYLDNEATEALAVSILLLNALETLKVDQNCFSEKYEKTLTFLTNNLKFFGSVINFNDMDSIIAFITLLEYMQTISVNVSDFVDNVSNVKRLSIVYISDEKLELSPEASQFFERFNLTKLNINGLIIKEGVVDNLLKAFGADLQSLEYLFMNNCNLSSRIVIKLMQKLQNAKNIKKLDLCNNNIDDDATKSLVMAILHWNFLECVIIDNNYFKENSIEMFEILKDFLKCLNTCPLIDYNGKVNIIIPFITLLGYMMDVDVKDSVLVENVSKVKNLQLDCSNQYNNNVQFEVNASMFFRRFINLTHLDISGIIIIKKVADNLAEALDVNLCSLQHLIMNECQLTSTDTLDLFKKLKKCLKLKELQLCNNYLDNEATEALAVSILHLNALETLKVGLNCFSEKYEKTLTFLTNNLKFLDSVINFNDMDSIIAFITLLEYMQTISVNVSDFVDNVSKVEKLLLDCSNHNNSNVQFIVNASKFFTRFVNLTDLNISGMVICQEVADNLAKAFDSNLCSLECLIMNNCQLTSAIAFILIIKLRKCLRMRELQLCNNFLDDDVTQVLVISIFQWNYCKVFKFEGNQFNKESKSLFQFLLSHLKFSDLSLNLSGNLNRLTSFITLLGYMKDIPTNASCYIDNISKVGCLGLDCLEQQTSLELTVNSSEGFQIFNHLISLNISGVIISENTASCLVKAFSNNLQLERLFMNKCQITSPTINVFCQQLKFNSLKVFELAENFIDDEATEALAIAILHWNLLEHIELEKNWLSIQSMLLLEMLTKDFKSEVIINCMNNHDYVVKSFIKVLDYANNNSSKRVKQFLDNLMKVTKVSLKVETPLDPKELKLGCLDVIDKPSVFTNCKQLRRLKLNGIYFTSSTTITILADCLTYCFPLLQELILTNCNIDSNSIVRLFSYEQRPPIIFQELTNLDLSDNFIDEDAVNSLVTSILQMPKLTSFHANGNEVGNYLNTIFRIILDWKSAKSSVTFYKTSDVVGIDHISAFFAILSSAKDISRNDSCQINNITKINKLVLKNLHYKVPLLNKDASYFITRFTTLQELNLTGICIEQSVASIINNALTNDLVSLQVLVLCKSMLDSDSAKTVLLSSQTAIPVAFNTLREIDLSYNYITDEIIEILISSIIQMPNLIKLNLDNNQLSKFDMKAIFDIIFEFKTVSPTVYKNDHTSVNSFIIMLSSMKKFTTEHIIQVRNISKIEKLTLQSIKRVRLHKNASVFFQRLTKLSVLRLFGIYFEPQSIAILSGALAYNLYSLEELMLSNCKLDSKSAVTLLSTDQEAIPVCFGKLRIIDFSCNLIDDDALKPLVNSFLLIPNLQKPHLYGNKFTNIMPILGILYEWINYKTSEINYSNRHDTRAYTSAFFTLVSCIEHATLERSFVKNITTVSSLTLANKHLDHPIVLTKDIAIFFQKFTNLTELSLSGIHIHPKAMKNLAYTLQSNPGLLKLKLNRCQLDSDLVKTMFYSGGRSIALMNLKELDLSYNSIDNKATSILIKSLIQMPKLAYLSITGNRFNRSGERALHSVLSEFSTYKLSINYNSADNSMECVEAFLILLSAINDISKTTFNQIHNITQVRKLYLHCKESLELSKEASLFFGNFFKLTTLSLSGICITTNVAKNLAKVLQNNHDFLQILVLNQCKLDSESVLNLFTATQMSETVITFHSLSTLDLSNNNIKNDAAYPLITVFLQMPKLIELNVDGNYFSEETFITLEFMFAFNKNINIIDSTNPTICRYRSKNISNSFLQKLKGKTCYGKLLHYDYSFINLYCMYNRTIVNYKPSVYALAFIDLLECAKNVKSIQVRNILKLEKLIIILNHVQWKNTVTLSEDAFTFLTSLSNLKELNLTGVSVDTKDVMVSKFSSLQKLTLADCRLSSEATITILSLLNKCTVTDLCLSHNQITCKVGNAIKTFVDKNSILIDIDLSYNEFKDEGATIIVQSLHTCSRLKRLNLSHNGITDEFTYQLVTSLLKMPNCVEMDVSGNNFKKHIDTKAITDIIMDCKRFQPVVKYDNESQDYVNAFIILIGCIQNNSQEIFSQSKNISTAHKLCLQRRFQSGVSCELTKEASLFLKKFSNLNEMKLNGIFINTAAAKMIAETIAINLSSMQIIELSHCLLDSDSAIVIASALKKRRIRELCFSHNNINHKAATGLKLFLENNDILIKFDISHNFIGTEGIKVISQSFVSCKSLELLNLSCNGITDEATVSLVSSLVQMPNLTEVGYHGNDYDIAQVLNIITELKTTKNSIAYHNAEEVSAFLKLLACVKDVPTENSPQVKNLRKIGKLCLKTSSLNQPINKTAALVIKQFTTLTTLSFDGIIIALRIAEIMADALSSNLNCLQYLRLCNCQLDSTLIITLLPSNKPSVPEAYKVLKEIDLSDNNICDKAIVPLAASLLQMCQLEKLTFDNNQFKKYNIDTIFQIILECKAAKHTIEYFSNEKDSVKYVASFLALLSSAKNISLEASQQVKNLMNLSKLSLCCKQCVLNEESSFFFERFTSLQSLHLYGITIQLQAVTVFAKALALNLCSLEELTLSACGLTSETANEIISSLRKEKLKVLYLSHNAIDDHACKVINDFVVNNNVLTEINISHNNLTTKGSVTLTEGLINCRNLEKLDLSYNKITDDATESLHKLMKQFYEYGNFKTLQIDNNYLSQQSIKKVQSAVSWSMCTIY